MPFATVIASGMMPECWYANHSPVRPAPVCTSSMISSASCRWVSSRAASRKPSGRSTTPASPLMGSTKSAATASSSVRLERLDRRRDVLHPARQRLERLAHVRLAGERERAHRAAVERVDEREHPGARAAGLLQSGELERRLVRLGARVAEEHAALLAGAREADEPLGELELRARS